MRLIDTHCHLYSDEFKNDVETVINRAKEIGVTKFYLPAIDSETHDAMIAMEETHPGTCIAMMGLHPCSVKEDYKQELSIIEQWLSKRKFVAIGEIGLDHYWSTDYNKQQEAAFHAQIEMALHYDLPIVIHTRDATDDTLAIVEQYTAKGLRGIFHCFGGSYDEARRMIDANFLLGVGGVLTYKKSGLAETLAYIDLSHLVLETDAPYLTPVPFRGKRNESSYLQYVIKKLAETKNCSEENVANITTRNAEKIFGL